MLKFLHAADLHLDSPFAGLPPKQAAERRQEQRQMLADLSALCIAQGCALLLLSGDLFDSENAYPETVEALCKALGDCGAQVFIAPGNHDYLAGGSPYFCAPWPKNVRIFTGDRMECVYLPELDCAVWGAGFRSPETGPILPGFRVTDESVWNLGVLHGDAANPHSPYNCVSPADVAASGLDYLALGHIHKAGGPFTAGKTVYAWPGTPMGRGFDETGEKGVLLGTLDESGVKLEFLPIPGRRYEILDVPVGDDALSAVLTALPPDTSEDIYRIRLTGESDPPDLRALYESLKARFFALTLRDCTVPRADLWAAAGEDTLRGQFLSALRAKLETAGEAEKAIILQAARLGLDAMRGGEERFDR